MKREGSEKYMYESIPVSNLLFHQMNLKSLRVVRSLRVRGSRLDQYISTYGIYTMSVCADDRACIYMHVIRRSCTDQEAIGKYFVIRV